MLLAGSKQFLVHVRHQANVHVLRDCLRLNSLIVPACACVGWKEYIVQLFCNSVQFSVH